MDDKEIALYQKFRPAVTPNEARRHILSRKWLDDCPLAKFMRKYGLTAGEVAGYTDTHERTIANWLHGIMPKEDNFRKLAEMMEVSERQLAADWWEWKGSEPK